DERTGLTHDYTRKSGVAEAVILSPATAPAWCTNRTELRNSGLTEPARRVADLLNIELPDNATSYTLRDI
ncbi:MobA/MobL family protein, partial [Escherichia coli]|nr:MobA/MobL family protein [Escherichia coli]